MKKLAALLLLVTAAALQAQQPEFMPVLDFAKLDTPVILHRAKEFKQQARVVKDEQGQPQFRVDWTPSAGPHYEFCFDNEFVLKHTMLKPFTIAQFEVRVYLPENHSVFAVNLRLRDNQGEVMQYHAGIPAGMKGWQTLRYTVDSTKVNENSWGGNRYANKKLDFPACFYGIAGNFKREGADGMANWMLLGEVKMAIMLDLTPAALRLDACNDVRVMTPGHEGEAVLKVINTTQREVSATLDYKVADERGQELEKGSRHLRLQKGETIGTPMPRPRRFGVTVVTATLTDDDKRVPAVTKSVRYAYMVPAGPTPGRSKGFLFGVCSHPQSRSQADQAKEALAAGLAGVKILREDIDWNRMQPAPDVWNFESFDKCLENYGKQGIELQALYSFCAGWAVSKDWKPVTNKNKRGALPDFNLWAQFIRTFVERYRHKVRYVEVWNEPDLYGFANFPAEDYVQLMKIAYTETKKLAPEMTVLTGGFALMPPSTHESLFDQEHMKKTLTWGRGFYDVHAFHGHGRYVNYREQLDRMFAMRQQEGVKAPWYANETANPDNDGGEFFQAVTLFQKFLYSWARGSIGYNWYDLRNDGFDPTYGEHHFGLITFDFYPKTAYVTYNMLATLFTEATYLQDVQFGEALDAFAFRAKNGDLLIPCWSMELEKPDTLVALTGITGQAELVDLFGNVTPLHVENQALMLKISHEPYTLRLKGQNDIPVTRGEFFSMQSSGNVLKGKGNSKDFAERQQDFVVAPGAQTTLSFRLTNPTDFPQEASMALTLPQGLTAAQPIQKVMLAPRASQTLTFVLTAQDDYGLGAAPTEIAVKAAIGTFWSDTFMLDATPVAVLPPRRQLPQFTLDKLSQYTKLVAEMGELQHLTWSGPADLSARVWLDTRNNDTLLLKIIVTDDKHVQPYKGFDIWQGDSIQFALNFGSDPYYEFGLTHHAGAAAEVFVFNAPKGRKPKVSLKTSRDEKTHQTVYEAAIPFAEIGLTPQILRDGFLFDVLVNDNDGEGREGYLELTPGIGAQKTARHFCIVQQR